MRITGVQILIIMFLATLATSGPQVWILHDIQGQTEEIPLLSNPSFGLVLQPDPEHSTLFLDPKNDFAISRMERTAFDSLDGDARKAVLYGRLLLLGSEYASSQTQISIATIQDRLPADKALQLSVARLVQHRVKRKSQGALMGVLSLVAGNSLMTYSVSNTRDNKTLNASMFFGGIATALIGTGLGVYRFSVRSDAEEDNLAEQIRNATGADTIDPRLASSEGLLQ